MSDCKECSKNCSIKGGFDIVFEAANQELKVLHTRQFEMNADDFWTEIDFFYHKYPSCITFALDEMIMEAYMKDKAKKELSR